MHLYGISSKFWLKLQLMIGDSSVEFWVGCDMSAVTMGACMHAFSSENGTDMIDVNWHGYLFLWI